MSVVAELFIRSKDDHGMSYFINFGAYNKVSFIIKKTLVLPDYWRGFEDSSFVAENWQS